MVEQLKRRLGARKERRAIRFVQWSPLPGPSAQSPTLSWGGRHEQRRSGLTLMHLVRCVKSSKLESASYCLDPGRRPIPLEGQQQRRSAALRKHKNSDEHTVHAVYKTKQGERGYLLYVAYTTLQPCAERATLRTKRSRAWRPLSATRSRFCAPHKLTTRS